MHPPLRPSRRRFLSGALATTSTALLPRWIRAEDAQFRTISLFVTTDLHGHIVPTQTYGGVGPVGGLARCATQIRRWRRDNPDSLLLDAGDVYQGTPVSQASDGRLMIDLMNRIGYDGWVVGNHEFDWGHKVVTDAIRRSRMPVLSANLEHGGKPSGSARDEKHPLSGLAPSMLREVGGMKIGIVGLTTTGLPYWLPEALLGAYAAVDPVAPVKKAVEELRGEGADTVVAVGHMGLRSWGKDDFANRAQAVVKEVEGIDVFVAGHTHKDMPTVMVEGAEGEVLYTQAGYHGIYCGRVDLTFDRESRRLVDRRAHTTFMDDRFPLDPMVMEIAGEALGESKVELATEIGKTTKTLTSKGGRTKPSDLHFLLGAAIKHGLAKQGAEIDGVVHGIFDPEELPAGKRTMADAWKLVPYDNSLLVAHLTPGELAEILEEAFAARYNTSELMGLEVVAGEDDQRWSVADIRDLRGKSLPADKRVRIAFNSYDAQSGGQRYERLREIVRTAEAKREHYDVQTRDLLVDYFLDAKEVGPESLRAVWGSQRRPGVWV